MRLIGLTVMGQNLVTNMSDRGYGVAVETLDFCFAGSGVSGGEVTAGAYDA